MVSFCVPPASLCGSGTADRLMAATKDFYSVLGVAEKATADEIKKAYRRLAKQHHPDVNKSDARAAERFKEISEAYNVLGDATKRAQYDEMRRLGAFGDFARRPGGGPTGGFRGGARGRGGAGMPPGYRFEDFDVGGFGGLGDLFSSMFGAGAPQGAASGPEKGQSIETTLDVPFHTAALGGKLPVELDVTEASAKRERKKLLITVPPGTDTGSKIRLKGQGRPSARGGPAGDLLVTFKVAPDPVFAREGLDLIARIPVNVAQATLGSKVSVATLDEKTVTIAIPAGTPSGKRFRVRGQGVVKDGKKGDLLVEVRVEAPTELSAEARRAMEAFAEKAGLTY